MDKQKHARFKIDYVKNTRSEIYGVYRKTRGVFGVRWKLIQNFSERESALRFYEKIKALPEYLS